MCIFICLVVGGFHCRLIFVAPLVVILWRCRNIHACINGTRTCTNCGFVDELLYRFFIYIYFYIIFIIPVIIILFEFLMWWLLYASIKLMLNLLKANWVCEQNKFALLSKAIRDLVVASLFKCSYDSCYNMATLVAGGLNLVFMLTQDLLSEKYSVYRHQSGLLLDK